MVNGLTGRTKSSCHLSLDPMREELIVFATYWNEIDWIEASLEQIDAIDPVEVIICDGCFDPARPLHSDDGTKERIEAYVRARPHARLISPVRTNRPAAFAKILAGHAKTRKLRAATPARLKALLTTFLFHHYRLNQALTFQKMISLSRHWAPGKWFMTLDADQYYPDEMIALFRQLDRFPDAGLVCAHERTFFHDFEFYTEAYEAREFNNMPHRIFSTTNVMPTRDIVLEEFSLRSLRRKGFMKSDRYISRCMTAAVGRYNHYKFKRNALRAKEGYMVGDRKAPQVNQYLMQRFDGIHPSPVRKLVGEWSRDLREAAES